MRALLLVAILGLLLLKASLLPLVNVNWDEFRFLSRIHELERGELTTAFQTFHVRLFAWIPAVATNEVDQVLAGRRVAFALRIGSCVLLFLIGRRLYGSTGALVAVLASLGFSHLMRHGEAFRADPIIAVLFLAAAALLVLLPSSLWPAMGAAAILAVAGLVSMKSAVYLPTTLVLLTTAAQPQLARVTALGRVPILAVTGMGVYAALFGLHTLTLPGPTPDAIAASMGLAKGATVRLALVLPAYSALVESLQRDSGFWLLVVTGAALALTEALRGSGEIRRAGILVLGFLLPLGTLFLYRNTYAYFYAVIIPSAALACGLVAARLESWLMGHTALGWVALLPVAVPLGISGWKSHALLDRDAVAAQRTVLEAVRLIFPGPVPYLDRCSMVGSYPKVGPFMSTLVLSEYRRAGKPVVPHLLGTIPPVFVLANAPGLDLSASWESTGWSPHRLLREDFELLKRHYIHHWGPVWVAGVEIGAAADSGFELPVAGPYTIEAHGPILLDGEPRAAGDVVQLAAGSHVARSAERAERVILRYGDHLPRPRLPPPVAPVFLGLDYRDLPSSGDKH